LLLSKFQDVGRNLFGVSLLYGGEIVEGSAHFDQGLARYDRVAHLPLATRFGEDQRVANLSLRSWIRWLLGYPEAALRDTDEALKSAREIGQVASLMFTLYWTAVPLVLRGDQGCLFAVTGDASNAVQKINSGITAARKMGFTLGTPRWLSYLAVGHANLGEIDAARSCIVNALSRSPAISKPSPGNFARP
jgi:hypothetical protein